MRPVSRRELLPTAALLGGSLLAADPKKPPASPGAEAKSAVLSAEAAAVLDEVSARNTQPNRPTGKSHEDNIAIHMRDCTAIIQACRKQKLHKLEFRGNLTWAHESLLKMTSLDIPVKAGPRDLESWVAAVNPWVDGLKEAGFAGVDINMGLYPWHNQDKGSIAKSEKAVERIRRDRLRLALNPELNPWASGKLADFEAYTQASVKVWSMLAQRFQPEVLMLTHEIFTMRWRLGFEVPVEKWVEYLKRTAAAVKQASPKTLVGVGFVPGTFAPDLRYAEKLLPLPEMDLISVDIYDLRGFDRTNTVVKWAKAAGKRVFIEETWRAVYWPKETEIKLKGGEGVWDGVTVPMEKYQPIDALWMEMVAVYAAAWGMDAVVPFWTQVMFKYLQTEDWQVGFVYSPEYNNALEKALLAGERTKTFAAWKKLIQELGKTRAELA
jgi:hypothetical protein